LAAKGRLNKLAAPAAVIVDTLGARHPSGLPPAATATGCVTAAYAYITGTAPTLTHVVLDMILVVQAILVAGLVRCLQAVAVAGLVLVCGITNRRHGRQHSREDCCVNQ
jgi:hypothetical protein